MLYHGDGRLGVTRSFDSSRPIGAVRFDNYWVGPIWVQVLAPSPGDVAVLTLVWGDWRRRQHVQSGHVLSTRKALQDSPPLHFHLPPGWRLSAGLGYVPSALDINHGWYPRNVGAAGRILRANVGAIRAQLSRE